MNRFFLLVFNVLAAACLFHVVVKYGWGAVVSPVLFGFCLLMTLHFRSKILADEFLKKVEEIFSERK